MTWAGIGGWNGLPYLGQAGTIDSQGYSFPAGGAWYEVLPDDPNIHYVPFHATSGYKFYVVVNYLTDASGNPYYAFYWYNYYTGTSYNSSQYSTSYSGDTAEAIVERPTIYGHYSYLSNYGNLPFEESSANNTYMDQYNPDVNRWGIHMYDTWEGSYWGGTQMADPSTIGSYGSFTDTQDSCD